MASVRSFITAVFLLAHISHSLVLSGRTTLGPDKGKDAESAFKDPVREVDPPALHAALHSFNPRKYRHSIFGKESTTAEAVHREDPSPAAGIIVLARRGADNTSTTITIETTTMISIITTTMESGAPPPLISGSVAPGSVAPGSVAPGSVSYPAVSVSSTRTIPASPELGPTTHANSPTSTLHAGQLIETTNADGITIVSTVDGGVITPSQPTPSRGSGSGGSESNSGAILSSSEILETMTLPNGGVVTLTSFIAAAQGGGTGTATGGSPGATGSASAGLQASLATKSRTFFGEAVGVFAGAVVFAVLM